MKTGIMQTGLSHPERLEAGWDWFTGSGLYPEDILNLKNEGWEPWISAHCEDREVWIRPTPKAEVPEVVAEDGGPDD